MARFAPFLLVPLASVLVLACGGHPRVCTPGASVACVGTGGCAGGQVCNADGTGFGVCDCGGTPDAATTDGGGGGGDSGAIDAGSDVGVLGDAGSTTCDPVAQVGCA